MILQILHSMSNVKINPVVMKWARETAHMDIAEAAKIFSDVKNQTKEEKLIAIEKGEYIPSLVQLEKMAKKYDRPLSVLMNENVLEDDYSQLPFFRKENKTEYDSALTLFIRDVQRKQDWARNYLLSEGHEDLDFIGSLSLKNDVVDVALNIKDRLGLPSFAKFKKNEDYFKSIKESFESNSIFVSITGSNRSNKSIEFSVAQGFAIADSLAPFIFINTKNTTNAKIFTAIHEVVHLFLNESGISDDSIKFRQPKCREDEIENFCNIVASEILMPRDLFRKMFLQNNELNLRNKINKLSQYFLVSQLAVCVRLWKLNLIEYSEYNTIYPQIESEIMDYLREVKKKQKEAKGGDYYANMRQKNGKLLSQLVFYAYKENKILGTDFYNILRVNTDKINTYFDFSLA